MAGDRGPQQQVYILIANPIARLAKDNIGPQVLSWNMDTIRLASGGLSAHGIHGGLLGPGRDCETGTPDLRPTGGGYCYEHRIKASWLARCHEALQPLRGPHRYLLRVTVLGKGITPDSKRDFPIWVRNYEKLHEAAAPIKVGGGLRLGIGQWSADRPLTWVGDGGLGRTCLTSWLTAHVREGTGKSISIRHGSWCILSFWCVWLRYQSVYYQPVYFFPSLLRVFNLKVTA